MSDVELVYPRAGLPTLIGPNGPLIVETLEPPSVEVGSVWLRPPTGDALHSLRVVDERRTRAAGGRMRVRRTMRIGAALAPGPFTLETRRLRAERAVWVGATNPEASRPLRVAQISDLHVGSRRVPAARLQAIVDRLNRIAPDVVLVTGDVANDGGRVAQLVKAREILWQIAAPTFVVPGNHDHGFGLRALTGGKGRGWEHFASAFHARRQFAFTLGNWSFIGFDSGASRVSAFVTTHGLRPDETEDLSALLDEALAEARDGVVFFSHAPIRTRLTGRHESTTTGPLGRMRRGARELEALLKRAACRGQRVLHLCGHTHWTDVFELDGTTREFRRWSRERLLRGASAIVGRAALINSPSATLPSLKRSDPGAGITLLELGSGPLRMERVTLT
jgi:Icc-related predicted phosphoesterase